MKGRRRLLYFGSFAGLAATAAVAAGHACLTSVASLMIVTAIVASVAGAPGLVRWRAAPLVFVLLPLGAYLLANAQVPSAGVSSEGSQISYLVERVNAGIGFYERDSFPLEVAGKPELRMVLSLVVYLVISVAAFAALSRRLTVLGIAMLIPLLGFGLTVDDVDHAILLTLAFVVFSGCTLVTSLSLDGGRRKPGGLLMGAAGGLGAALIALVIVGVTPVAAGQPWLNWETFGEVPHLTFEWKANDPGQFDPQTEATVMRVKSPVASYWRANALDSFNGVTWSNGAAAGKDRVPLSRSSSSNYELPPDDQEPPGKLVTETFSVESVSTDYLFVGGSPRSVRIDDSTPLRLTGERALAADSPLGPGFDYTVTAWVPTVTQADLQASTSSYPNDIVMEYTALPFPSLAELSALPPGSAWGLTTVYGPATSAEGAWHAAFSNGALPEEWSGLYRLNQEIVGEATAPYDVTLAIRDYLSTYYAYSLEPPETDSRSPYAAFLFETKTGYCQHFAGAMATLLRFNGIPARVAVGFAAGDREKDGVFVVSRSDAHAWVEVYFSGLGWLPFDPTPGRTVPGRGDPAPSPSASEAAAPNRPSPSPSPRSASPSPRASAPERDAGDRTGGQAGKAAGKNDWLLPSGALGALVVGLVAWPTVRVMRRRRALRRGDCETRLRTAVEQLYLELADWDIETPGSQTLDETALLMREALDIDAAQTVDRLQAVLYGGRPATYDDITDVVALRRATRRRLREQRGRAQALLALYGLAGWTFRLPAGGRSRAEPAGADA